MNSPPHLPRRLALAATLASALWLAGCSSTGPAPQASHAANARDYRRDAARHIYDLNSARIYKGQLPPLLYAVGTLQVNLDAGGKVLSTHWLRAPRHAPEVIAEIERTVRHASPFPPATRLGAVTWTDTWLWDESGRFQLDTLTEGQQKGE
jgi:protein TonB